MQQGRLHQRATVEVLFCLTLCVKIAKDTCFTPWRQGAASSTSGAQLDLGCRAEHLLLRLKILLGN